MKVMVSDRGFKRVRFADDHGAKCQIVESSSDGANGEPRLWLFTEGGDVVRCGGVNDGSILLTQEQAKKMMPHLRKFIRTGGL